MSVVQLIDQQTGQTLVAYYMVADYPTDEQLDVMETVVEFDLLRDGKVANWCRHHLLASGGCDVCNR